MSKSSSPPQIALLLTLMKIIGVNQTEISRRLRITVPAVNAVTKGFRRTPRIQRALTNAMTQGTRRLMDQIWRSLNNDTRIKHDTKASLKKSRKK